MTKPPSDFEPEYRSLHYGEYALDAEVSIPLGKKEQVASIGIGFDGESGITDTTRETRAAMLKAVKDQLDGRGFITGNIEAPYESEPYSSFQVSSANGTPFKSAVELRAMVENAVKPIEPDLHRLAAHNMVSRVFGVTTPEQKKPEHSSTVQPATTLAPSSVLANLFDTLRTPGGPKK